MKQVYIGMDVHDSTFNMCSLISDFEDSRLDDYFAEVQTQGTAAAVEKYVKKQLSSWNARLNYSINRLKTNSTASS